MLASEILGMIESGKRESIFKQAYNSNKNAVKNFYKKSVQTFKGNFRDINKVPDFMIVNKAKDECAMIVELGHEVMKSWFALNKPLCEKITAALKKCGYEPAPHDFSKQDISWKKLNEKDIHVDENELYYFAPAGKHIDGVDPLDATIMAALLGWSQSSTDENEQPAEPAAALEKAEAPEIKEPKKAKKASEETEEAPKKPVKKAAKKTEEEPEVKEEKKPAKKTAKKAETTEPAEEEKKPAKKTAKKSDEPKETKKKK